MNSRVSWNVEGIEPSVRERAEAAARRAGMSLGDWLNSTIGDTAPSFTSPNQRPRDDQPPLMPRPALPHREAADVAEIHHRLDAITRQIEQFAKPAGHEPGVARQLNDAISRLDARLSQINEAAPAPQAAAHGHDTVERAAAKVYNPTRPIDPFSLDFAISEITARQSELDGVPRMNAPPIAPAPAAAPAPAVNASAIERQLSHITSQIEALQRPDTGIEQSIATFRSELADIRNAVTEALPRRAIESLEGEIRSLARRIDDSKQNGIDNTALAGVERALGEIRETLHALTPAEQLAGFDDAIRNLGGKIDLIVRSSDDPGTMQQLEGAIAALRAIVSNVASNEALGRLANDVQSLSMKVDQLARTDQHSDSFAALEARIMTLTTALENRDKPEPAPNSEHLEGALKALSDRLDHLPVGNDSSAAFAHLEQRVSYLLERIETTSDPRAGNLGRVEDGLQDILRHLERQQASFAALTEARSLPTMDPALVDTIKRELSDMRFSQSETDRHTQDSLEVVHATLGHVVDRLAMIEGDLRSVKTAPPAPPIPHAPVPRATVSPTTMAPPPRPQLANPVQPAPPKAMPVEPTPVPSQARSGPVAQFDAAPREFAATAISHEPAPAFAAPKNELLKIEIPKADTPKTEIPKAISDILDPPAARTPPSSDRAAASRPVVDAQLPPDFPLEPGTRPQARIGTPSERIAASEEAISEIADANKEQANASSFIAAARRAAKAAAASGPDRSRPAAKPAGTEAGGSTISSKIRSLLVGVSVVVIVLGSFKVAMTLLDGPSTAPFMQHAQDANDAEPLEEVEPTEPQSAPVAPAPAMPSLTSPTPMGRQSLNAQAPATQPAPAPQAAPQAPAVPYISPDVTGSITPPQPPVAGAVPVLPPSGQKLQTVSIPASERLPDAIGGAALRSAALKGDATAAFEIGMRYAEGKGVAVNFDEAAKWYGRAADAGVVPAMFRLGTLFEKGMSGKKDVDAARRYYLQAAERGNAKAMHNLAVLDADGAGKGANYKSASLWFRKAAERGVADSQFNLGILYARGIGVEQNLAESFKWFSLAAAQGDADAGRKRDDVAKRLDPSSLAAAKLAIQSFTPEGQPDDAINVHAPAGGWDGPDAAKATGKRAAK